MKNKIKILFVVLFLLVFTGLLFFSNFFSITPVREVNVLPVGDDSSVDIDGFTCVNGELVLVEDNIIPTRDVGVFG